MGRASRRNDSLEQLSSWNNHHRHIGTVVHKLFEHIGKNGITHWEEMEDDLRTRVISRQLGMLGVPAKDHASGVAQVRQAVDKALAGERGRWILAPHPEGACEWAVSGVLEGTLTHAVIDRTFMDHEGVRWVIDYKTSQPDQGQSLDDFLSRERELYRGQLNVYKEMFRALEPGRDVEAALYFPMLDAWCALEG
jgi:ATP-dependent exoDNAse (exonuclease V) beta subunit